MVVNGVIRKHRERDRIAVPVDRHYRESGEIHPLVGKVR